MMGAVESLSALCPRSVLPLGGALVLARLAEVRLSARRSVDGPRRRGAARLSRPSAPRPAEAYAPSSMASPTIGRGNPPRRVNAPGRRPASATQGRSAPRRGGRMVPTGRILKSNAVSPLRYDRPPMPASPLTKASSDVRESSCSPRRSGCVGAGPPRGMSAPRARRDPRLLALLERVVSVGVSDGQLTRLHRAIVLLWAFSARRRAAVCGIAAMLLILTIGRAAPLAGSMADQLTTFRRGAFAGGLACACWPKTSTVMHSRQPPPRAPPSAWSCSPSSSHLATNLRLVRSEHRLDDGASLSRSSCPNSLPLSALRSFARAPSASILAVAYRSVGCRC